MNLNIVTNLRLIPIAVQDKSRLDNFIIHLYLAFIIETYFIILKNCTLKLNNNSFSTKQLDLLCM